MRKKYLKYFLIMEKRELQEKLQKQ